MAKTKVLFESDSEDEKEYKPSNKKAESSDEESSSEEELSTKKPAVKKEAANNKRKREEDDTRDANGNQIFELSNKRRITVRPFSNGEPSIDLREVWLDKTSGEMRPGKSGICLPLAQWKKLKELMPEIDEAIAALPNKNK